MNIMQRTLKKSVSVQGIGVHSGHTMTLTLEPAQAGEGIRFWRQDLEEEKQSIPAKWDQVADTRMCTLIANDNGAQVGTIEHLMAALWACEIDNVNLRLDGPEVPVLDGSSGVFIEEIDRAGVVDLSKKKRFLKILKPIRLQEDDGRKAFLLPCDTQDPCLEMSFVFDFGVRNTMGKQVWEGVLTPEVFRAEIASARTFGFLEDVEKMRAAGLALGGSLDNAVVYDGDKVLNEDGLRFQDESVRHKVLDAVGDLYTAGSFIWGRFEGVGSGHAMNNALLRALFDSPSSWKIE
ncbi:MAG: UDP-3-O-[3-hydroxymyristoyl] N-acetylglucosamine deacetylase [bacterium]|nr:UDP-3-O-[3-hydroxymyristoyl] N-acetylglucosamine deacetylase [bacterium]